MVSEVNMSGALTVMNDAVLRPALWFPITVRVAWELHLGGVGVRSNVLEAARFHVFSHLPDDVPVHIAERLASIYSIDFIQRLREQKYRRPVIDPDIDMDVPVRWRQLFLSRLKEGDREVYWFYFSDGLSVERTAQKVNQKQRSVEKSHPPHSLIYEKDRGKRPNGSSGLVGYTSGSIGSLCVKPSR